MTRRVYVEKKEQFAVRAARLYQEFKNYLSITGIQRVRVLARYDIEGVSDEVYEAAKYTVFAEPPVDVLYEGALTLSDSERIFSVEFLPGQYDQRADSAEQCLKLLNEEASPSIRTATTYIIDGGISDDEFKSIKSYVINTVDSQETGEEIPETLAQSYEEAEDVRVLDGFCDADESSLHKLYDSLSLAMTFADFLHIQAYFRDEEKREPTITEIRVLDTYWSDHCRHTTFSTEIKKIEFEEGPYKKVMEEALKKYLSDFNDTYKGREDKYVCLMDMAVLAAKRLKIKGRLDNQEESDEINACSIIVPVNVNGKEEEWLLNFKNETHNHPTEIEPFGGAATCLGGAIRDPLSGRTYVYQAMRVTGAADPRASLSETMEGKLPQKKIVREAAEGYSSYGNQIGLATGYVREIYHPNYAAKRMEIGAVIAAAPRDAVRREKPVPGDVVILLGGRTGRDGIGGATGSSKAHDSHSTAECGAEVQKGNPPTERKLQRLFRRKEASLLIKKCNDFGAGGVSVAIGELADGLVINLDEVKKKYQGLDGTELAISESQERMAVVVSPNDADRFMEYAKEENLEATKVAVVSEEPRLMLEWRGKSIVDLSRAFLDTNGARQETDVFVRTPDKNKSYFDKCPIKDIEETVESGDIKHAMSLVLKDLNVASQKGLVEQFDGSIGAESVLMPHGGKYQLSPTQVMACGLPMEGSDQTNAASLMSYGFDPYLSSWSPYHGAVYAITESIAKIVAAGGDFNKIRFSFQEYFGKTSENPKKWGEPFAALLGAYDAQMGFELPAIGGKDSMSGSFNDMDVPPTLVSFAVDMADRHFITTPELKQAGDKLFLLKLKRDENNLPDYKQARDAFDFIHRLTSGERLKAAYAVDGYGVFAAVARMAFGNKLGVFLNSKDLKPDDFFKPEIGSFIIEVSRTQSADIIEEANTLRITEQLYEIGEVIEEPVLKLFDASYPIEEAVEDWCEVLEGVYPTRTENKDKNNQEVLLKELLSVKAKKNGNSESHHHFSFKSGHLGAPRVFIPVFPGTNCEYDSERKFIEAGAEVEVLVFRNQNESDIRDSAKAFANAISKAQIVMFPGGFSAGDEPEGSAKFFATAFRNALIKEEMTKLIEERDGLVLGICNGFQALIKLGLVPNGKIGTQNELSPTLTTNTIGRHVSKMAYTKVINNRSPWLSNVHEGDVFAISASHGEGRFVCEKEVLRKLFENGQIATMYVDADGRPSMDDDANINGSYGCVEGITSSDGRIFGKMCHCEREGFELMKNIYGDKDMKIFSSGVKYFM